MRNEYVTIEPCNFTIEIHSTQVQVQVHISVIIIKCTRKINHKLDFKPLFFVNFVLHGVTIFCDICNIIQNKDVYF